MKYQKRIDMWFDALFNTKTFYGESHNHKISFGKG